MRRTVNHREINKMTHRAPPFLRRAPLFLALSTFSVLGCLQKLDSGASDGFTGVKVDPAGGIGAPFPIITDTPPIGIAASDNGDPTATTTDPCDKLKADALAIRKKDCSSCHEGPGNPLDDIEHEDTFIGKMASSKYPGWKYVTPGVPETSLIYSRVVMVGEMPPPSTSDSPLPRPSISDMSVLRDWIKCLGTPSTTPSGGGGASGTGGATGSTTGSGGAPGTGGASGTGGRSGTGGMAAGTGGASGGMVADAGAMGIDSGVAMTACSGVQGCNNPMAVTTLPFNTTVTAAQACFEVNRAVNGVNCTNAVGRQIRVNAAQLAINNGMCSGTLPPASNGGYCVQVSFFGQRTQQPPATALTIL